MAMPATKALTKCRKMPTFSEMAFCMATQSSLRPCRDIQALDRIQL